MDWLHVCAKLQLKISPHFARPLQKGWCNSLAIPNGRQTTLIPSANGRTILRPSRHQFIHQNWTCSYYSTSFFFSFLLFFFPPFFLCFQFSVCRIHLTPPVIGITKINTLSTPRLFDFVYWLKRSISILLLLFLRLFSFKLYFKFYIEITISWSLQILIASFVINTGMVTHGTDFRIGWIKWISWYI